MPASRGQGGARGGGLAGGGRFELLSQGGAKRQEDEDAFMRDNGHPEKRKREGRQGGVEDSPQRQPVDNDSDITSAEATRMVTRSAEKAGAQGYNAIELSPSRGSQTPSVQDREEIQAAPTISDVMRHLLRMEEKENEYKNVIKEYKNEIKQLQNTVTALALDMKSLQESVPNWGSLQSSQLTGTTDSNASIKELNS
ncbi:hypothetical protein KCU64_g1000, partial [Aureobasidium melanogenum]